MGAEVAELLCDEGGEGDQDAALESKRGFAVTVCDGGGELLLEVMTGNSNGEEGSVR